MPPLLLVVCHRGGICRLSQWFAIRRCSAGRDERENDNRKRRTGRAHKGTRPTVAERRRRRKQQQPFSRVKELAHTHSGGTKINYLVLADSISEMVVIAVTWALQRALAAPKTGSTDATLTPVARTPLHGRSGHFYWMHLGAADGPDR